MRSDEATAAAEMEGLRARLAEAEEMLAAIRAGEVDAVLVYGEAGDRVYTLRGAEQPYRTLVEQMREGAAILTREGDILYCNRRFAELVGLPLEEVVGGSVGRFIADGEDRESLATLLRAGSGTHRGRLFAHDGRLLEVYCSLSSTIADGIERRSLIVADLTEIVDAQADRDRAERDNRAKDEFMAMLAHELRNPLGAIAGAVQVLDQVDAQGGLAVRARGVITRQVHQLARLVDDLLDVGRLVTGKITLAREPVDLADIVRHSAATAREDRRVAQRLDLTLEPVWIDADPTRIEQIAANLIGNAVKYTNDGDRIRVTVGTDGEDAVLRVEDDGAGIRPDLLPRIFDLFVQGEQTLDRTRGGLGIGLTLVRRLVELHGGAVSATSEGPGRGSAFTVRLRRIPAPEESCRGAAPGNQPVIRRRVLVIEDSQDSREMYRAALELAGHEVLEAADGVRGLDMLKSERLDIALVDIGLPGLDGFELARRFRAEPSGHDVLLVALTGYGASDDRDRAREAGFDHHLVKPVSPDRLRQLLSATGRA